MGFGTPGTNLHSPGPIGDVTPSTIAGTTLTSAVTSGSAATPTVTIGPTGNGFYYDSGAFHIAIGTTEVVVIYGTGAGATFQIQGQFASGNILNTADGTSTIRNNINGTLILRSADADRITITTLATFSIPIVLASYTVAGLPAAATAGAGATAFVTDSSTTLALGLGLTVIGGGANKVPVYSDGSAWKIG